MYPPQRSKARAFEPLLHLEDDRLAWVRRGPAGSIEHAAVPLDDLYPADVADRALSVARELGFRPDRIHLSLGATLLTQHVLRLPPAEQGELQQVFTRRAQGWLDCGPSEVEYVAVPHRSLSDEALEGGQDWSVFTMDRRLLTALQVELRQRGVRVVRSVSQRAGVWAHAVRSAGQIQGACLAISREHRETAITLLYQGKVVLSSALPVQLGQGDEAAAVAVVHEVRNLAGWWRKESGGQPFERVHLYGLDEGWVRKLAPALNAAVGAAEVVGEPAPIEGQWHLPGIMAALELGRPSVSIDLRLPPEPKRILTACSVLAVALFGAGLMIDSQWSDQRAVLDDEFDELSLLERKVARYEADTNAVEQGLAELQTEARYLAAVAGKRWPVGEALAACRSVLPANTRLVNLSLHQDEQGMHLSATGEAPSDPLATREALATIQAGLEASAFFRAVEIEPPSQVGLKTGQTGLPFSLACELVHHPDEDDR
jgi:Tfp pilus assembly protein PilN